MPKKPVEPFTVIRDTREQTPWTFRKTDYCTGTIDEKVDHGDYAIAGLEHLMFIERKATEIELAGNVFEKRFPKLLKAAEEYRYRYIICEFSLDKLLNYPHGSDLPRAVKKKIRVSGPLLLSKIQSWQIDHGIHVVFCDNKSYAQKFTLSLFKKIANREGLQ